MINFSEQLVKIVNMSDFNFRSKYPASIPRNTYQQFVKSNSTVRSGFRSFSDCFWVDRAVLKGFCFFGFVIVVVVVVVVLSLVSVRVCGSGTTDRDPANEPSPIKQKCLACHSPLADKSVVPHFDSPDEH